MKKLKLIAVMLTFLVGNGFCNEIKAEEVKEDKTVIVSEEYVYDENGNLLDYTQNENELVGSSRSKTKTIQNSSANKYGNGAIYSSFDVIINSYTKGGHKYNVVSFDDDVDATIELKRSTNCTLEQDSYSATGEAVSIDGVNESTLVVKIYGTLYPYASTRSDEAKAVKQYKIVHVYTVYPTGNASFESK